MKRAQGIEVRPPNSEQETALFLSIVTDALFPTDVDMDIWLEQEGPENVRVAVRGGEVLGGLTVQRMGQWFGGARVPVGCVRAVGVAPQHRAGGVGATIMCAALEELGKDGIPLAALYPATQPVYRRPGFEQAGVSLQYQCDTHSIETRDRALEMTPIEPGERPKVVALHTTRAKRTSGNLDRNNWLWNRIIDPPPWLSPTKGYWITRDGRPEGYVYLARNGQPPDFRLDVADVVILTAAAGRRLLTFFADHRSVASSVTWKGAPVDPLWSLMVEQPAKITGRMDWMLRLVDVPAALQARGYAQGVSAEVHLEVVDDVLPQNNGRIVIKIAGCRAEVCEGGKGEARIDVRGLAALYSGHSSPFDLLHTGQLEAAEEVLLQLAGAFAGPSSWMSDMF